MAAERPAPVRRAPPTDLVENTEEPKLHRITVDLGTSTDHMKINDIEYYHGQTYTIPDHMLASFVEIMHNTKMHEEVVRGLRSPTGSSKGSVRRI